MQRLEVSGAVRPIYGSYGSLGVKRLIYTHCTCLVTVLCTYCPCHMCVYVCIYVCMYIHIYTYTARVWSPYMHILPVSHNIPSIQILTSPTWGHQRKNQQTPQQTRIPSQPTSGDTNATDEQQKAKKTLDLRPTRLRWHCWMVTLPRHYNKTAY